MCITWRGKTFTRVKAFWGTLNLCDETPTPWPYEQPLPIISRRKCPFLGSCTLTWHRAQCRYHRSPVLPSYGIAARWVVPGRAGCSPRSFLSASSGWHPGERAAGRAACAPRPGRRACWCPALQGTRSSNHFREGQQPLRHSNSFCGLFL